MKIVRLECKGSEGNGGKKKMQTTVENPEDGRERQAVDWEELEEGKTTRLRLSRLFM